MPRPTPQHGLNIQPPFPFFSLHALTLCVHSPPQASLCHISCMCAFACINVLYVHPTVLLFCFFPLQFVWDQQKDINHSRDYYNLHFNLLAANVKAGRGVARFRASASGKEEAETVDLRPLSGDLLPAQDPTLSTPAHTRLQRHRDDGGQGVFEQRQQAWDRSGCSSHCCSASSG